MSVRAALAYYESVGPELGARRADQGAAGRRRPRRRRHAFCAELQPFHLAQAPRFRGDPGHPLDQAPDRRASAAAGESRSPGHDVKLGRGGIREIEFFAQTQQLIWGGRMPELRVGADLRGAAPPGRRRAHRSGDRGDIDRSLSLSAPARAPAADGRRRADPSRSRPIARGSSASRFFSAIRGRGFCRRSDVASRLGRAALCGVFRRGTEPRRSRQSCLHRRRGRSRDAARRCARLGFADPAAVAAMVRSWHHGRYRATRSQRARELLTELVPALLGLRRIAHPDGA